MDNFKKNKAFTLVELIVVIVILAILATIAFLSFSSQSGSARDSVRLSDTTNIRKGLELRQVTAGVIPMPANISKTSTGGVTATGITGVTISEGTINSSVLNTLSNGIKDPSGNEYRYSAISQGSSQPLYYQLALELENPTSMKENFINPFINAVFAATTDTSKVAQLKGNYVFNPILPSLFVLSGSTASASGGIYNPNICFVLDKSSTNTFSNKDNCIPKNIMNLKDADSSLVGYWDMETLTSDGLKMKDLSGNGNDGVFNAGVIRSAGIIGKTAEFNGVNGQINLGKNSTLNGDIMTFVINLKMNNYELTSYRSNILSRRGGVSGSGMNFSISGKLEATTSAFKTGSLNVGEGGAVYILGKSIIGLDKWYNLVYVKDGSNIKAYVNGNIDGEFNVPNLSWSGGIDIRLGTIGESANIYFLSGSIDDVHFYNRALSSSEIMQQAKSAGF